MVILLACEDEKIGDHWPLTTPHFEQDCSKPSE